jgi:NhaA family Na+:H+ antiporter
VDENKSKAPVSGLPIEPIHRFMNPLVRFLQVETASGLVLLAATGFALAMANSPAHERYQAIWDTPVVLQIGSFSLSHSLQEWINDGLMVIFFFVIGLEVKREVVLGELRELRRAALPIVAALGGMVAPAGIYLTLQWGQPGQHGWGIPMATDIAFVVGCMALLGPRVPHGLRVMLLSLAIADDIGSILVIAIGYTETLHFDALIIGLGFLAFAVAFNWLGVRNIGVYACLGILVWLAFLKSGVHATIAGVILGLLTPARNYLGQNALIWFLERARQILEGDWEKEVQKADTIRQFQWAARETISPVEYLEQTLHPWVAFGIMPIFALANAGVPFHLSELAAPVSIALILGLFLGKPLGILLFSWLAVRFHIAALPNHVGWRALTGAGFLAGIGFTMALFIAGLALTDSLLATAKIGILTGSAISALVGMVLMQLWLPKGPNNN